MNEHTNGQMERRNYIPLGINAGGIIITALIWAPKYFNFHSTAHTLPVELDQQVHLSLAVTVRQLEVSVFLLRSAQTAVGCTVLPSLVVAASLLPSVVGHRTLMSSKSNVR